MKRPALQGLAFPTSGIFHRLEFIRHRQKFHPTFKIMNLLDWAIILFGGFLSFLLLLGGGILMWLYLAPSHETIKIDDD